MKARRGTLLVVAAITAGLSVGLILGWRFQQTQTQRQQLGSLCLVVRQLIVAGDTSLDTTSYYQKHPAELRAAHERTREALRRLNCSVLN